MLKYYVNKDIFSSEIKCEDIVVRGEFRTVVFPHQLRRTTLAMGFLEPCCVCGEMADGMQCPFECAMHTLCITCSVKFATCPIRLELGVSVVNTLGTYMSSMCKSEYS